jgi:hypothetical protein
VNLLSKVQMMFGGGTKLQSSRGDRRPKSGEPRPPRRSRVRALLLQGSDSPPSRGGERVIQMQAPGQKDHRILR